MQVPNSPSSMASASLSSISLKSPNCLPSLCRDGLIEDAPTAERRFAPTRAALHDHREHVNKPIHNAPELGSGGASTQRLRNSPVSFIFPEELVHLCIRASRLLANSIVFACSMKTSRSTSDGRPSDRAPWQRKTKNLENSRFV